MGAIEIVARWLRPASFAPFGSVPKMFTAPGRPRTSFQQGRVNMVRYSLVILLGLCSASSAWASWADGLFDELSRDFGSVPRGPTLQHPFRLVNRTGSHLHIASVRVSCGCT